MMKKKIVFLFIILSCLCSCRDKMNFEKTTLKINDWVISTEIADTDEKRALGLMHRKNMPEDNGMLFVFDSDRKLVFWMKNTLIPLSVAYLSKDGTVKEIHDMEPLDMTPVASRFSVRYALEVNQGAFERHGIKPGDKVEFIP